MKNGFHAIVRRIDQFLYRHDSELRGIGLATVIVLIGVVFLVVAYCFATEIIPTHQPSQQLNVNEKWVMTFLTGCVGTIVVMVGFGAVIAQIRHIITSERERTAELERDRLRHG